MANIPKKVEDRFKTKIKQFKKILDNAKARDINESDTVTIVKDILSDVFGYDKYQEITSEYSIRGTYCDLAVQIDNKPHILIEVKAIGIDLKETHLRQATDYASKEGIDWIILTNGTEWILNRVIYSKPISTEFVMSISFPDINLKDSNTIEKLFLLTKEAANKDAITAYHKERKLKNKYVIASLLLYDEIIDTIRRYFNRLSKDVRITNNEVSQILTNDLIKRDVLESDQIKFAFNMIKRSLQKKGKQKKPSQETTKE